MTTEQRLRDFAKENTQGDVISAEWALDIADEIGRLTKERDAAQANADENYRRLMAERERCAQIVRRICGETRHVSLGDNIEGFYT